MDPVCQYGWWENCIFLLQSDRRTSPGMRWKFQISDLKGHGPCQKELKRLMHVWAWAFVHYFMASVSWLHFLYSFFSQKVMVYDAMQSVHGVQLKPLTFHWWVSDRVGRSLVFIAWMTRLTIMRMYLVSKRIFKADFFMLTIYKDKSVLIYNSNCCTDFTSLFHFNAYSLHTWLTLPKRGYLQREFADFIPKCCCDKY